MKSANHQWIVRHCPREFEHLVQFRIVLVGTAGEARPDEVGAGFVELPPGSFERQHVALAVRQLHVFHQAPSLTAPDAESEDHGGLRSPPPPNPHRGWPLAGSSLADPRTARIAPDQPATRAHYVGPVRESPVRPFLIGVAGGSSSGKTTVAERLAELAGADHLALIKLDSYYVALRDLPIEQRRGFDYDHPDAFDWLLLNDHLARLAVGDAVPAPIYDYVEYQRSDEVRIVRPAQIVVVEGILVLWEASLRERFDLKVFLDTDADLRFIRRVQRDVAERGRSVDSVIEQYLATVRPAHEQFIEPSKRYADVIIPNGGLNRPALDVLVARVRELAGPVR